MLDLVQAESSVDRSFGCLAAGLRLYVATGNLGPT